MGSATSIARSLIENSLTLILISNNIDEFRRFYDYCHVNDYKDYGHLENIFEKSYLEAVFGRTKEDIAKDRDKFKEIYCHNNRASDLNWYGSSTNEMLKAVLDIVDYPDQWKTLYAGIYRKANQEIHTSPNAIESRVITNCCEKQELAYYDIALLINLMAEVIRFSTVLLDYLKDNTHLCLCRKKEYSDFRDYIEKIFNEIVPASNLFIKTSGRIYINKDN